MSQFVSDKELEVIKAKMAEIGYPAVETYIPEYQVLATPVDGEKKFWHFAFKTKRDKVVRGFNAGLIKMFMQYSPTGWPELIINDINRPSFDFFDFE
jgi:hypothetical protein